MLLAYAGPGQRTVATFEPTYQMHAQIARVTGATVVEGERAAISGLDPAEVERVITEYQPHVVLLTSPNDPTGLVEPAERVHQLLDLAPGWSSSTRPTPSSPTGRHSIWSARTDRSW